ncbi:MAG: NAD(+) synthase [Eubacteriales bacterium]
MRNFQEETEKRVAFIQQQLKNSGAEGIVFGNSGGKDSMLVGILCKKACENTVCLILPCSSNRNYGEDLEDAQTTAKAFHIDSRVIELTSVKEAFLKELGDKVTLSPAGMNNIAPRLRMTTLYAVGASENRLVAGTGNRSEGHMGYFTKWGDGGYDFNPIADLTATEIFAFLQYLEAPEFIQTKPPSAGLFDGQTDEDEMGVTYAAIDKFLETGEGNPEDLAIIDRYHQASHHKRKLPPVYGN